MKKAATKS
jgi:hypothetical protein